MPFSKNDPNINTDGRKKGSKNKRTLMIEALQRAYPDIKDVESVIAMKIMEIVNNNDVSDSDKLKALSTLSTYVFNKPTESMDVTATTDIDVTELFKFKDKE